MIKIKKNPYRSKSDISEEDAYKLGEVLELINQLELFTQDSKDKFSKIRTSNVNNYMNKISEKLSFYSRNNFNKGRKHGEKESWSLFIVLNKKQLRNYQHSLIDEADVIIEKNNL